MMEEASGIKRTIYDQLLTRMRDPFVKDKLFIVCSNPDIGWIRSVIYLNDARKDPNHPEHEDYNPNISCFVWETALNKHLPPDYIALNSKNKPDWWIKRFLKGSMDHSEGMVYPNFASTLTSQEAYFEKHKLKEIPKTWEQFTTLDHGIRNPTAFYKHAINPDTGEVVTFAEHYKPNLTVPEHVKYIKPMMEEIPIGRLRFAVADPSIRNRTDPIDGKSVQGLYQEYGLYFAAGNNDVEAGILKVNAYIEAGKWVIFQDKCPELAKEGIGYKYKDVTMDSADKNLDEKPVKSKDHGMDSCRYGFMRLPDDPELLKTIAYAPPNRYTQSSKNDEYDDDFENEYAKKGGWESYGY